MRSDGSEPLRACHAEIAAERGGRQQWIAQQQLVRGVAVGLGDQVSRGRAAEATFEPAISENGINGLHGDLFIVGQVHLLVGPEDAVLRDVHHFDGPFDSLFISS